MRTRRTVMPRLPGCSSASLRVFAVTRKDRQRFTDHAAAGSPPAAVGDTAELLDAHMHQLTARGVFIAAHDPAESAQLGQPEAGQHPVHRRGMQTEQVADAGGPNAGSPAP